MPTRIDIELTSVSGDGSWTWRAAGAREPKGVLDGSILPAGAAVGDQLRAETEQNVEGIRVLSIVPPKPRAERNDMLELLPSNDFQPVTQQRVSHDRHDSGRTRPRRNRDDRPPRDGGEPGGDRSRRDRGRRDDGGAADERRGPRRDDDVGSGRDDRSRQRHRPHRPHFTPPPELPQRPKPKRLRPGKQHLGEVLESLAEEQRPVAELALQGMAAVRQRLREDNVRLKAAGKPEMPEATVLKMAEDLLPQLRVAEWLDRAEAAQRQLANLDLRDLRSVVAASDDSLVVRDESTRALAAELKTALSTKQEEEFTLWLSDVEAAVDVGRVVRALRLSAEPPKAGVPFPPALGSKLGAATVAALSTEDPPERWITVLEAAAFSPVRTLVTPAAAPAPTTPELVATVTRLGPLLPQVAALFEIEVPDKAPTPKPLRPAPRKKEPARKAAAKPAPPPPKEASAEKAPPADPAEPALSDAPEEAQAPAEPLPPGEAAAAAEAVESNEPVAAEAVPPELAEPAEPQVPVDEAAPADVEGVAPAEQVEPAESAAPVEADPAAEAVESNEPVAAEAVPPELAEPAEPQVPVDKAAPTDVEGVPPAEQVGPAESAAPVEAEAPVETDAMAESAKPPAETEAPAEWAEPPIIAAETADE